MRIGLFTDVYLPSISGVVVAVETLKNTLEQQGHEVFVITTNSEKSGRKYIKNGNCIKIPGIPIGIYDYHLRITYPLKAVKMVKDLNLDIIHSHTEFGMGHFAKSMAKKLDIPHVHTYHTMYQDTIDYVTKGLFPRASGQILKMYMKSFLNNNINEIIVPTKKTKDFLQKSYGIRPHINIIPNGVNIEKFYKENCNEKNVLKIKKSLKLSDNDFIILWIGRLGYEKRIDYLIERQKELVAQYKNCKLVIVGDGPEKDKLKDLVKENEIENNVIFAGKVPYDKINNYYQIGDVIATASFFETQGLTLVEALAGSKPVICCSDEVFKNVITNGYNGFIFKSKKSYCESVKTLINDKEKLKIMEKNARISAEEYSISSFGEKMINLYEKILQK